MKINIVMSVEVEVEGQTIQLTPKFSPTHRKGMNPEDLRLFLNYQRFPTSEQTQIAQELLKLSNDENSTTEIKTAFRQHLTED